MSIDRDVLVEEGYLKIIDALEGKKRYNPLFLFLFFTLIGGAATFIVLGWLQFLLLLLWEISQTKLQIFVVVASLVLINSFSKLLSLGI